MNGTDTDGRIATAPAPTCYMCGVPGEILYRRLPDRLFGAPGTWDMRRCPAPGCGLVWLDPMPTVEEIGKAYQAYYTHEPARQPDTPLRRLRALVQAGYLARRFGYRRHVPRWASALGPLAHLNTGQREQMSASVLYLPSRPGGRLLEVGCGSGARLATMRDLGWEVYGVEPDGQAVEAAREHLGLPVAHGTLEEQRLPDGHFDAVAMSHVIEHVHDPLALLTECVRILRPGGRLVVMTPNSRSLSHRLFKSAWLGLDPPRHLHLFSAGTLTRLARTAGLSDARVTSTNHGAHWSYSLSRGIASSKTIADMYGASRLHRGASLAYQAAEGAALVADRSLGDELLLLGRRTAPRSGGHWAGVDVRRSREAAVGAGTNGP